MNSALDLDSDAVTDHQAGHPVTVDQYDPRRHLVRVGLSVGAEPAGRDEDTLACLITRQGSDERLDRGAADDVVRCIALGLDVDATQTKSVLVDDAIDAAVVRQLGPGGG